MGGTLGVIVVLAIAGVYYYYVMKFGDKLAESIEESLWGEPYHYEGVFSRKTYSSYSVVLSIFASIFIGVKAGSLFIFLITFVITSVVFYTAWIIIEDAMSKAIGKGVDAVGDKVKDSLEKKGYNMNSENQSPHKLSDNYSSHEEK